MKKELWIIFLIVFIGLLGFGIVIPTLPFIAERFGASNTTIGFLLASYSVFQFAASPVLGRLSDKYGRKPILAMSLFGTAIGYIMIAFAPNLFIVFLSRAIDGATGGNISVAQAYIADITKGKERTKAMGLIGASFGLGFIFGPLIGGLLSAYYGFAVPYLFAAALAFLNAILIMIILPESEKKSVQRKVHSLFSLKVWREIFNPIIVLYLALLMFIATWSFSMMQGIFPLYTQEIFSWGEKENGWFFAFIGLATVITQGGIIRILVDKIKEEKLIQAGFFLVAASSLIIFFSYSVYMLYISAALLALGLGFINTSARAKISLHSSDEEQGIVLGAVEGLSSLARAIGPITGGILIDQMSMTAPFLISSIFLIFGLIFSFWIFTRKQTLS